MHKLVWPQLTRQEKTDALRKFLSRKKNCNATGADIQRQYFRGVTPMGLITHCWRNGPSLPNARVRRHGRARSPSRASTSTSTRRGMHAVSRKRSA